MQCEPENVVTSQGFPTVAIKEGISRKISMAEDKQDTPYSPPPLQTLQISLLQIKASPVEHKSIGKSNKPPLPEPLYDEMLIFSKLKIQMYKAFVNYRKFIAKAAGPFMRLDPARSMEDFMQEAYIPFSKAYFYCLSNKVETSKTSSYIFNCVRHHFIDQYRSWSLRPERCTNEGGCRNNLWKDNEDLHGICKSVKEGTLILEKTSD
jgi:hypothetical protein